MAETTTTYTIKVGLDDDGFYFAEVMQLQGCFASGSDLAELSEALAEAMSLYLSTDDVAVTVRFGDVERALRVIDGDGDNEAPVSVDFALAH